MEKDSEKGGGKHFKQTQNQRNLLKQGDGRMAKKA